MSRTACHVEKRGKALCTVLPGDSHDPQDILGRVLCPRAHCRRMGTCTRAKGCAMQRKRPYLSLSAGVGSSKQFVLPSSWLASRQSLSMRSISAQGSPERSGAHVSQCMHRARRRACSRQVAGRRAATASTGGVWWPPSHLARSCKGTKEAGSTQGRPPRWYNTRSCRRPSSLGALPPAKRTTPYPQAPSGSLACRDRGITGRVGCTLVATNATSQSLSLRGGFYV